MSLKIGTSKDTLANDELLRSILLKLETLQGQVDYSSEQTEYVKEILEKTSVWQASSPLTTISLTSYTYPLSFGAGIPDTKYIFTTRDTSDRKETGIPSGHLVGTPMVPLHKILEVGAVLLCFVSLAGLSSWLLNDAPLISPFAATLGLLASPFFYAMGRVARK